ncbi:MAG: hypothetical protein LBD96_03585 [Treponema sp.]|jgi:hypothetical protein|nr:hypothetical protein [Treponema sp.]
MADNVFHDELDPELAALLGAAGSRDTATVPPPDFSSIFGTDGASPGTLLDTPSGVPQDEDAESAESSGASGETPDVGGSFPEITKKFEESPHSFFADPNYYKIALSGEGDSATRTHGLMQKYLNSKDPKDRSVFRQQFITAFWDFLSAVAKKCGGKILPAKRFLLRFGILHPVFLNQETRAFFSSLIVEDELGQPVYYLDEWLKNVGTGKIQPSTTDEAQVSRASTSVRFQQLLEKAQGKLDGNLGLLKAKDVERRNLERNLQERVGIIVDHSSLDDRFDISAAYSESQKRVFADLQEILKGLLKADRELESCLRDYRQAEEDVRTIQGKIAEEGGAAMLDTGALSTEFETIRQMVKMTVGRQGNHFPVLTSEYFHCGPNGTGFRENVLSILAAIESIDPECFCRVYKNRNNRIVPYTILLPTYGDTGFCWEPFSRHNRATSRGRIVIPMYPKNLYIAVLSAVGDLRWQVAKEKASYYWMEEGLTGNYYQWFQKMKFKGNIKDFFVQDYIQWMTRESEGTQKLDKEVRGVFWRFMPFSQSVKEKLKNRSFVYQELYQRDLNRAMSDGY